ncbi:MAG TPA: hypothetical protein VGM06_04120 [Polyangiaceae bacterium]|jgi:hypothetical protein
MAWGQRRYGAYEPILEVSLGLSLVFSVLLIVYRGGTGSGELRGSYSDHIRHVEETWTFLHKGFAIYRGPFSATAYTAYPHFDMRTVGVPWPEMPVTYPVGTFAVFLIPTIAGAYLHLSTPLFLKWIVIWVVLLTHVALLALGRSVREARGRTVLLVGVWLFFLNMCLYGFYDGVWVGLGALSVAALSERRPGASLLWFAAAAASSLKAVSFLPVAAWAFMTLFRSEERMRTKVAGPALAALACAQALWTGVVTFPFIPKSGSVYEAAKSPLEPIATTGGFVILIGVVVACVAVAYSNWLVAVSVLLATAVTTRHAGHSWHGAILIPSALLPGALASDKNSGAVRELVTIWMFVIWEMAFNNPIDSPITAVLGKIPW